MNIKPRWRKGFGLAQIMAMIIVVIPTFAFIITILFDYWTVMQLDNRLKLMSHRTITIIDNNETLGIFSLPEAEKTVIASLCPSSMPTLTFVRIGDMPAGQTKIESTLAYDKFNHLEAKRVSSIITSYSYRDQNGSFKQECKGTL